MTNKTTAGVTAPSTRIERVTSPLGIEAWLVEDYTVPIISMDFAFMSGSANDPADKLGRCHLMADLLEEGAGDLDSQAFQEVLDDYAVEVSFDSNHDSISGGLRTLSENADKGFELMALALCKPRFDSSSVKRVRAQTIAGLKRAESDAERRAWRALTGQGFKNHPYGNQNTGTLETVPGIGKADVAAAHKAQMTRDTLKIAVVGAINGRDLPAILDRVFGDLPAKSGAGKVADTSIGGLGDRVIVDIDVPQSTLALGRPGMDIHDADFPAAHLVNHILGGGSFTSRLWTEVREKRGLAYSVWTQLMNNQRANSFYASTSTSNERVAESLSIIEAEILRMAEQGPTAGELEQAKKFLIGSYALRFDTSRKIASQLVHIQVQDMGIDYIAKRNAQLAAVTLDEARRAAHRVLGDGKLLVAAAGRPVGIGS